VRSLLGAVLSFDITVVTLDIAGVLVGSHNVAERSQGGPEGAQACAVSVDKLGLGKIIDLSRVLEELPNRGVGASVFVEVLPQRGQEMLAPLVSAWSRTANHKACREKLVS
jgi:hypothetical protein